MTVPADVARADGGGPSVVSSPDLQVQDLVVSAGGRRLLEHVHIHIHPGELVALTGPSGIGKTTLLRCIAGLSTPDAGHVHLGGLDGDELGWPTFRRRVVYLAQRPAWMDVDLRQNLVAPLRFQADGDRVGDGEAQIPGLLAQLGLESAVLDRLPRLLSEGQQQRAALIRGLLLRPAYLLLDEPTAALDPETSRVVETLLVARARADALGALVITHTPERAKSWATRMVEIGQFAVA